MPSDLALSPGTIQKKRSLLSAVRGIAHWISARLFKRKFSYFQIPALGLRYTVKADTIFSWHLAKYRAFESDNTNFLTQNLGYESGGLFVDVGANFGWFTCLFSRIAGAGGKVVAFEPAKDNLALLRTNLRNNNLKNVEVIENAVGAEPGKAPLHLAPATNPGMHSFVAMPHTQPSEEEQTVDITTLDIALRLHPGKIRLLKIDIEGYEIDALLGAKETLARCERILVEYSPGFLNAAGHRPSDLLQIIRNAGFVIHKLDKGGMKIITDAELTQVEVIAQTDLCHQLDLLCIRDETAGKSPN